MVIQIINNFHQLPIYVSGETPNSSKPLPIVVDCYTDSFQKPTIQPAFAGVEETRNQAPQGALAAARGANDHEELPWANELLGETHEVPQKRELCLYERMEEI